MKKIVISTLFVMQVLFTFAQTTTGITGKVVDSKTQKPLQNVVASIQNTNFTSLKLKVPFASVKAVLIYARCAFTIFSIRGFSAANS